MFFSFSHCRFRCRIYAGYIVSDLFLDQESSTVAAGSACADYGRSSSTSANSSPASTGRASTTSYPDGTSSVHGDASGWFWHPSSRDIHSPSTSPAGCAARQLSTTSTGDVHCARCQPPGRGGGLRERVGAAKECCRNCPQRGDDGGGGYVRSCDVDDALCSAAAVETPSPTAELLGVDDLFSRKFTVDQRHGGRMLLVQPPRRRSAADVDSESDDVTAARSEREGGMS